MLLANGANIVAMQWYDNRRGYFENTLVDSISKKMTFRSGISAGAETPHRPTVERHAGREDGGHLRDDRWVDVCE
jgi:hypothetical protein